jgi:hypothetical protein
MVHLVQEVRVIINVISRVFLTCVVVAVAFIPTLFVGFFGGSSAAKPLVWILGAIFVTGIGWSLFPLIRHSRPCRYASYAIWLAFGVYLWIFFGEGDAHGWLAAPWLLASLILGVFLNLNPPQYSVTSSEKE